MKKSGLYRLGSAFLAALMVFTCMPQDVVYVRAEEEMVISADADGDNADTPDKPAGEVQEQKPVDDGAGGQPGEIQDDFGPTEDENGENIEKPGAGNVEPPAPAADENIVQTVPGPVNPAAEGDGSGDGGDGTENPPEDPKETFMVNFNNIKIADGDGKTYDGSPIPITGLPEGSDLDKQFSCTYEINGTLGDDTAYAGTPATFKVLGKNISDNEAGYEEFLENAPAERGTYTLRITTAYEGDDMTFEPEKNTEEISFEIRPLLKSETRLVGVAGVSDKEYDGEPAGVARWIGNAKVQTDRGVEIKGAALSYRIEKDTDGENTDGAAYEAYEFTGVPDGDKLPKNVGKYKLSVNLEKSSTGNWQANAWSYSFAITQKAATVTVKDQEMYVSRDGSLEAGAVLPADRFADQYQIEGILDAERDAFTGDLTVHVRQAVDSTKTGIYDLEARGISIEAWPNYSFTFASAKLTVKAKLKRVENDGVLKAVSNVPNGLTLAQIAEQYLQKKTAVIYWQDGVADGEIKSTADIRWNTTNPVQGSYNTGEKSEQNFTMGGTIVLPDLVYVDNNSLLNVTVSVNVREAYAGQALKPYANVAGGKVAPKTQVTLSTQEEGASIYYTVDNSDPRTSKTVRLYNSAIEINSTMTIRAISRIYGKKDSEELRVTYYWTPGYLPENPDNPNKPEDPDEPTVPPEDMPSDGKIPDDLWMTDVTEYTYTGKAIRPEVRVYDYKTRLEEKRDYTISYKNNVNAADKNSAKAPVIIITGRGNYEGKINKTFTIEPKNITDPDVKADGIAVASNNKQQKPVPVLTWNGKKLANKRDYTYTADAQTAVGSYPITLTGTGNYTGERKITFIIADGVPASRLAVSKIPAYIYTGSEIRPEPTVKSGRDVLEKGRDYTLTYEDNTEVGTASVIIRGTGQEGKSNYFGVKRVTFQIKPVSTMNKAKLDPIPAAVYTGNAVEPACTLTMTVKVNGVNETRTLVRDTDYTVTYLNNVRAGTATVQFEGKGAYSGILKRTYRINAYDLSSDPEKKLEIQMQEAYPYVKGGSMPKPVVKFDGRKLTEGTDYTLSYRNHTKAGNYATVTVRGRGNFKGNAVRSYRVDARDITPAPGETNSIITVTAADKVYQKKANIYKTKIQVFDTNGKALAAGTDYDKNVVYTYAAAVTVSNKNGENVQRKAGDLVDAADIIPKETQIQVTVNAKGSNYLGTATGYYRIVELDIARARVTIPVQTYTGKEITLDKKDITVVVGGVNVSPESFEITGYSNNIKKGTAKVTIRGKGIYGGTKTVTFKIKGKSLLGQMFG